MTPDMIDALVQNVSFGALFVVLFVWTLRANEKREARYLSLLDCYGKQLENIASSLNQLKEQLDKERK